MKKSKVILSAGQILILIVAILAFTFQLNLVSANGEGEADSITSTPGEQKGSPSHNEKLNKESENPAQIPNPAGPFGGKIAKWLGVSEKPLMGNLVQGAAWAGSAYFAVGLIGEWLGLEEETTSSLQKAVGAGLFAGKTMQGIMTKFGGEGAGIFGKTGLFASHPMAVGLGVGVVVFLLTYKKEKYYTITYHCLPWEAPIGGGDCEKCNDEIHVCSEYRCKSLGQACELENAGTENPLCVWKNPNDVSSPAIQPWQEKLTKGYQYTDTKPRPPSWGTRIIRKSGSDKCIEPFTPIEFGIQTDKPAQCKIDFKIIEGRGDVKYDKGYDEMQYYFGENSLFAYNHVQRMNLPSPDAVNDAAEAGQTESTGELEIQNSGRYEFYVRCKSANGFYNAEPYVIKFCVSEGPDSTPPQIIETSITDKSPVQYEIDKIPIIVYTNEPAECRWSKDSDINFNSMENEMTCAKNLWEQNSEQLYECSGELTGVEDRKDNVYYFRCKDQPWQTEDKRNTMAQGYKLTLIGTQPLNINIESIKPETDSTISGATTTVDVVLELETQNGYKQGEALCYYSLDNETFAEFAETNSYQHKQIQYLPAGNYEYYFRCVDLGGNMATAMTSFKVYVDAEAPKIVRVLYNEDKLEIMTDEDADCYYHSDDNTKCIFAVEEAEQMSYISSTRKYEHITDWLTDKNYYIKCMDKNEKQPLPTECSIVVRPVKSSESG